MTFEWMDDHCEDGGERPKEYCERLLFPLFCVRPRVRPFSFKSYPQTANSSLFPEF